MIVQGGYMGDVPRVQCVSKSYDLTKWIGVSLIKVMPLVSLTNVWEITSVGELSIRGIDVLFVFALWIWWQYIFLGGRLSRNVLRFLGLIILYVSVSLCGIIFLPDYRVEWAALIRFIQTMLWGGLALTFIRDVETFKIVSRNVVLSGSVLALFSIYLQLTNPNLHRVAGFFSAAGGKGFGRQASFNEIGALYALASLLSLCYLFWRKKGSLWRGLLMGIISLVLNVIGLILVQSRSGIFAFVVGSLVLILPQLNKLLIYGKIRRELIRYGVIFCLIIAGIVIGSAHLAGVNRLIRTFIPESSEFESATTRLDLWGKGLQIWLADVSHFLVGYGFRSIERFLNAESAHNFFLNIGLWSGLTGLTFIMVLLIWPLTRVMRSKAGDIPKQVVTVTFSVAFAVSLFGNVLVDPFYGGSTFLLLYGSLAMSHSFTSGKR